MKQGKLITQYKAVFSISDDRVKDHITWKFVHKPHVSIKNEMRNKNGQDEIFASSDEYFEVHIMKDDRTIGKVEAVMCQHIEYYEIEREHLD
ncbi:hypothetical protein [Anaerosinus massiliensis]|uniref:hypothetical protein n=1 Tax=Massilibacillus massiliensis TaxID=1806837 RepID=UPI000DA62EFA|nr:hypothetical protein [Massilibacillus massiliensis]